MFNDELVRNDHHNALHVLPETQTIVLHAVRTWFAARHPTSQVDGQVGIALAATLDRIDSACAATFLENLLATLDHCARRPLAIGAAGQLRVSTDERLLLGIIVFAQEGRPSEALLLLRALVRPEAARLVLRNAEGLATELALSNRFLHAADLALPPRIVTNAVPHGAATRWPAATTRQ